MTRAPLCSRGICCEPAVVSISVSAESPAGANPEVSRILKLFYSHAFLCVGCYAMLRAGMRGLKPAFAFVESPVAP